jgi:hypothetical protein
MVQFDVAALTLEEAPQPSSFGIAFHPDANKRFCQLQPEEQATISREIAASLEGCTYGRLKLRSGAYVVIAKCLSTSRDNNQDRRRNSACSITDCEKQASDTSSTHMNSYRHK